MWNRTRGWILCTTEAIAETFALARALDLPLARATRAQLDCAVALGHADEDMAAVYYASARR